MTQMYIGVKMIQAWPQNRVNQEAVELAAKAAHMANREHCQSIGDMSQPEWDDAPQWQKDSAMAGVRAIIENPDTTPEQSHEGWLAQKQADGWKYGPVKDPDKKEHPCFVPYSELPEGQKAKDDIFGRVVRESLSTSLVIDEGYAVKYSDSYTSWSPKDVFEKAYFPMGQLPNGTENDNKITQEMVDLFTGTPTVTNISDKSTLVKVTPLTGFEQYEVSSCVDPANYDPIIGEGVATRKIKDRIWGHLGFVLQWAKYGLRK